MSRKQSVAVITGASRGIGKAIFNLFLDRSINAIGISRSIEHSDHTRRCDIRKEADVESLYAELLDRFGRVDILVNNAGVVTHEDIFETSLEEWENVFRTNLTGAFLCSKYILGHMKKRGYGKIVNISSIAGRFRSSTASVAYTCSKYGLIGMTRQLAYKYAAFGINVNCVCPSQTRTSMLVDTVSEERIQELIENIPAGRLATPKDVAEAVYFLCSDAADYINSAVLDVNGAQF